MEDKATQINQALSGVLPESLQFLAGPIVAAIIILVGFFISKIAAAVISGAINRTGLGKNAKITGGNIGKSLSKAVFWVLWLVFIMMGLSQFPQVAQELTFLSDMMETIFGYIPQLIIGGVVLAIGIMLSNVVKNALTSTLEVAQVDRLASRFTGREDGEAPTTSLAASLGGLVKAIVVLLFAIAAISIWDIPGFSDEVTGMLGTVLDYIPNIAGAAIILGVAVFIGRFVSGLVKSTLPALGIDNSLSTVASLDGKTSNVVPSNVIATIAFVGIVLMGLTAAMNALGIPALTDVFDTLLQVGGNVVLGSIIIGAGFFIANFVSKIVTQTSGDLAGKIIKYVTIIIVTFMGLSTMNLGEEIVATAFEYSLGAAAVAAGIGGAIAFGLGGREWAGKKLQEWMPVKKK